MAAAVSIALVGAFLSSTTASRITFNPNNTGFISTPPFQFCAENDFDFENTQIVQFNESWCNSCSGEPDIAQYHITSPFAFFQGSYSSNCFKCGYEQLASMAYKNGAIALIWYSYQEPGHETRIFHDWDTWKEAETLQFPTVEIGEHDAAVIETLLRSWRTVTMNLSPSENPWLVFFDGPWIAVQVMSGIAALFAVMFTGVRFGKFLQASCSGLKRDLALFVIGTEFACCLLRFIYIVLDPLWSRGIFSYATGRYLLSVTISFEFLTVTLITLKWSDLLARIRNGKCLAIFPRIVFLSLAICLVLFDLLSSSLSAFYGNVDMAFYTAFLLAAFSLLVGMWFVLTGSKLMKELKSAKYKTTESTELGDSIEAHAALRKEAIRITRVIQWTAIFMIISNIAMAMFGVVPILFQPTPRALVLTFGMLALSITSVLKTAFFKVPIVVY